MRFIVVLEDISIFSVLYCVLRVVYGRAPVETDFEIHYRYDKQTRDIPAFFRTGFARLTGYFDRFRCIRIARPFNAVAPRETAKRRLS